MTFVILFYFAFKLLIILFVMKMCAFTSCECSQSYEPHSIWNRKLCEIWKVYFSHKAWKLTLRVFKFILILLHHCTCRRWGGELLYDSLYTLSVEESHKKTKQKLCIGIGDTGRPYIQCASQILFICGPFLRVFNGAAWGESTTLSKFCLIWVNSTAIN